jgi:hypothetical protein
LLSVDKLRCKRPCRISFNIIVAYKQPVNTELSGHDAIRPLSTSSFKMRTVINIRLFVITHAPA